MSFVIRAATPDDLQALYEMAKLTGGGFTNLPAERGALAQRLERTAAAFGRQDDTLADDLFVLALENTEAGPRSPSVRGTSQVFSQVGQSWPFYTYRLATFSQHSRELARTVRAEMLSLTTDLEGCSEVGGLFPPPQRACRRSRHVAGAQPLSVYRHAPAALRPAHPRRATRHH